MARPKKEETQKTTRSNQRADNRSNQRDDNRERGGNRQKNSNRIGALWINRKGQNTFMSGELEINGRKIRILVFKNTYKDSDNQPDYNILLPRDERRSDSNDYNDDLPF